MKIANQMDAMQKRHSQTPNQNSKPKMIVTRTKPTLNDTKMGKDSQNKAKTKAKPKPNRNID